MFKNNEEVLDIVFQISDGLEYEVDQENIVTILEKQDHWIQNAFRKVRFKIPKYKRTSLDQYGSYVFLLIDGHRNVKEIGENLEKAYGDEIKPVYERLLLFLNHIDTQCHYIEMRNP